MVRDAGNILGDARQARVHHVLDPRNGDGCLGHVGGHDDLTGRGAGENPALLPGTEPGKQGQDHGPRKLATLQGLAGLPDILLGGHEDQDVPPGAAGHQSIHGGCRQLDGRAVLLVFRVGIRTEIACLHRIKPPGHLDHRCIVERLGELLGVDGGRGNDQLQVSSFVDQLFQDAEHKVDVQAALVGLVDDNRIVFVEPGITLGFRQQNAVGNHLDVGLGAALVLKADLVAHRLSEILSQLLGDAGGHGGGGNAPGLGAGNLAADAAPGSQAEFGDLGGFARSRSHRR